MLDALAMVSCDLHFDDIRKWATSPEATDEWNVMTAVRSEKDTLTHLSTYERRVALVEGVISANTDLDPTATRALAVQILHTIDEIAEKMR